MHITVYYLVAAEVSSPNAYFFPSVVYSGPMAFCVYMLKERFRHSLRCWSSTVFVQSSKMGTGVSIGPLCAIRHSPPPQAVRKNGKDFCFGSCNLYAMVCLAFLYSLWRP